MFAPILFVVAFYSIVSTCALSLFYKLYFSLDLAVSQWGLVCECFRPLGEVCKSTNKYINK